MQLADWLALEAAADAGVFVLRTDEPFMLPAFRIGDSFEADYAGQRVTVRTVSCLLKRVAVTVTTNSRACPGIGAATRV